MTNTVRKVLFVVAVCLAIAVSGWLIFLVGTTANILFPRQYITTDLDDYGEYVGNYDNASAESFISSFFPEELEDYFDDVKYSYRAQKGDTYAFEAYLEFQIEDEAAFESYISEKTGGAVTDFQYDADFKEHVISDEISFTNAGETTIRYARIGKILYSEKSHRIVYVAIGVYDGGIVSTDFLCEYFTRFGIDPMNYKGVTRERLSVLKELDLSIYVTRGRFSCHMILDR